MKESRIDGLELPTVGMTAMRSANPPAFRLDVVRSVRQHRALALGVFAATLAAVVLFALSRKPMYKAESLTYVEPLATRSLDDGSPGVFDPSRYDSYLQQQIQTAERPDILEQAIASLPAGTWQQSGEDIHAAAARLAASLKVQRVAQSYQLSISLEDVNPSKAAAIVNAATTTFLQQGRHDETVRQDGRLQLLTEEKARIQSELDADQKEQTQLGAQLGMADPAIPNGNPYDAQLASIRAELVSARQAHDVAAAQLSSIASRKDPEGAQAVAEESISNDASMTALKQTITSRRAQLANQMASLTPANPVYKQDQQEMAQLDKQLEGRVSELRNAAERKLEDRLRLDLERTGEVEARLNAQLAQQTAAAHNAAPRLQRANELAADITRLENRFTAVDSAIRGLSLDTNGPGTAHLVVAASVPVKPEPSKRVLLFVLALPLALIAAIGAAVFARKRDPHLYTEGDIEDELGFLPMVAMPALTEVSSAASEEYLLRMGAAIERAYRIGRARTFVFTAASATTDITSFVHGLRLKLIGLGFKTLAIDAEEALLGEVAEAAGVHASRKMAAADPGRQDGYATASLDRLKENFDIVLLEARPLLHSAEAEYAARTTDATILIVESAVTTQPELRQCAQLLQRLKTEGVGVALVGLHRNVAGREMRASIAEAERKRPTPVSLDSPAGPQVLGERVYDLMQRRVQREFPDAVPETPRNVGRLDPQASPERERVGYVDRTPGSLYAGEGTPVVESVGESSARVTAVQGATAQKTAAATREVLMQDESESLRRSLAQAEFSERNVADDLPDGQLKHSFFRFFERRQPEPAATPAEIERAFDRMVQRTPPPPPPPPTASEPASWLAIEPDEEEPPVVIHAAAATPAPAPAAPAPAVTAPVSFREASPAVVPSAAPVVVPTVGTPVVHALDPDAAFPQSAEMTELLPPAEVSQHLASTHAAVPVVVAAAALNAEAKPEALHAGEFRPVAPPPSPRDALRAELLPGHATDANPAGSLFVLREELKKDHSLMPRETLPPSDHHANEQRIADRLFAATQRTSRPEAADGRAERLPQEPSAEHASPSDLEPGLDRAPDWLTSAEAERIRQLLSRFSEGVAKSQPQPESAPSQEWFGQRSSSERAADAAQVDAAASAIEPHLSHAEAFSPILGYRGALAEMARASAATPAVKEEAAASHSELHFGVSPYIAPAVEEPVTHWPHRYEAVDPVPLVSTGWIDVPTPHLPPAPAASSMPAQWQTPAAPQEEAATLVEEPIAPVEEHVALSWPSSLPAVPPQAFSPQSWAEPVAELQPESWSEVREEAGNEAAEVEAAKVEPAVHQEVVAEPEAAAHEHVVAQQEDENPGLQWPAWPLLAQSAAPVENAGTHESQRAWYEAFEDHFREERAAFAQAQGGLTAAEPLPLATAFAPDLDRAPQPVAQTSAAEEAHAPVEAESAPSVAAPPVVPAPPAPGYIEAEAVAAAPVIEAVTSGPTHAVLPTNPISTLYANTAQPVSRASAEAVLARTLQQPTTQVSADASTIYFREPESSWTASPVAPPVLSRNGNGNGNGHGKGNSNGNGHGGAYEQLLASTPFDPLSPDLEFEPPVPWKTRKPPVSAPTSAEVTPQPGRWQMLRRFDPQSAETNGARRGQDDEQSAPRESAAS